MTTTAWQGGQAASSVRAVLAANAGPMTLEGTNTWVLRDPDASAAVVVDPGPADLPEHLTAVAEVAQAPVALTLLTHHHRDHTGAVHEWRERTGSPVRGAGEGEPLRDGEVLAVAGLELEVLRTPGHTRDSVCFLLESDGLLLTGDTVLGRGTTVVPFPEGDLGAYLESLERILALIRDGRVRLLAPGHGPVVEAPEPFVEKLRAHRLDRLEQVRRALAGGARTADDVVAAVYGDLGQTLAWAAGATVRAQLAYLGHPTD